ncbi:hypothetical protein ACFL2B_02990 [Patescibacteria group bacterium]
MPKGKSKTRQPSGRKRKSLPVTREYLEKNFVSKKYLDRRLKDYATKKDLRDVELRLSARITNLEEDMKEVKADIKGMRTDVHSIMNMLDRKETEDAVQSNWNQETDKRICKLEKKVLAN